MQPTNNHWKIRRSLDTAAILPIFINHFFLTRLLRLPSANPAEGDDPVHNHELLFSTAPSLGHVQLYDQCEMQPSITFV